MKLTRIISALCLTSLFSAGFAFSQNKKPEPKSLEIKANILVRDVSGNSVDDIKIENLKVFEDGVEQKITYFARKEPILNVGIIADNTGSMRVLLDSLVMTAKSFANHLTAKDEAFLVRYVSTDKLQLLQDWTSDRKLLDRGFDNLFIEGGQSAIIDALYSSTQKILEREKKEKTRRYALILITDGDDRVNYYNETQLYELFKGTDIQIFPILFPNDSNNMQKKSIKNFIARLALETGGTAHFLKNEKSDDATRKIADELRSQYVIGYTSTKPKRDGSTRKLTVQVADNEKGEKRQGIIRESFVVPKE